VGSFWSRKAIHNWVGKFSRGRSKVAENARNGRSVEIAIEATVPRTTVKRVLYCGFRRTGKANGKVYQCWWKICRERNVFFFHWFEYHMFYVLHPYVTYLLTLPCILLQQILTVSML
jgi:hypothetical protein